MNQEKNERNRISTEKSQKITTLVSIIAIVSIKSYIKTVLVFFFIPKLYGQQSEKN